MTMSLHDPRRRAQQLPLRWLVVLLGGTALFGLLYAVLRDTHDPIYVPSLLLLGATVVPATFATFLHETFGRTRLSVATLATGAILGGTVATVVAGQLEFDTIRTLGAIPTLLVGLIEESAKLAVPVLLLLHRRVRPLDGLVLGVAVASGFAALETMGYGFVELLRAHGALVPVTDLLIVRALSSPGGHAAWTGLACAALFAARTSSHRWWAWMRFAFVFGGVVLLHAAWDSLPTAGWHVAIGGLSFTMLMVVAWRLRRSSDNVDHIVPSGGGAVPGHAPVARHAPVTRVVGPR